GVLTTAAGGGAATVDSTKWNGAGFFCSATTVGPDRSTGSGLTAASGVTAVSDSCGNWSGPEPPTAPAKTSGVITASPKAGRFKAGRFTARLNRRRAAATAARPRMRTQPSSGRDDVSEPSHHT